MTPSARRERLAQRGLLPLLGETAERYHVTTVEILSARRTRGIVAARHGFWRAVLALRIEERPLFSQSDVGRLWGVDHTTVSSAMRAPAEAA